MNDDVSLRRLGQIAQPVTDLPRAVAFYERILGIPLLFQVPRMAFFELGEVRLMLALPEGGAGPASSILYFTVDDLNATHRTLETRGVHFLEGPTLVADMGDHELWMAFFEDTEDNRLALMSEVPKGDGSSPGDARG